jgi:hypothetical protein
MKEMGDSIREQVENIKGEVTMTSSFPLPAG